MHVLRRLLFALACAVVLLLPRVASAQEEATITGVVKDASGAVLPGVTVEASSPVLIEKVRTAVSDGTGQYPNRQPAARHLHRHLHADRLFDGEA